MRGGVSQARAGWLSTSSGTASSAGREHAASVSHAPGRNPAAVGASGREWTDHCANLERWPSLPATEDGRSRAQHIGRGRGVGRGKGGQLPAGCMPLTIEDILVPACGPCTSGRSQVLSALGSCASLSSRTNRSAQASTQHSWRVRPAMSGTSFFFLTLTCMICMNTQPKNGS